MMTPRSPVACGSSFDISVAGERSMLKVPVRLTLITLSKSASAIGPSRPTTRLATPMPAQLTSTRAGPWALVAWAIAASAEAASETSQATATPLISAATVSASLALRSHTATLAPCAARRRAVAAPNPDAPPVTMAAWSFNSMVFSLMTCSSNSVQRDHLRRGCRRIERLDQVASMLEHRALVDRALVGDFAAVDRQRRIKQHRARDAGR